MTSDECRGNLGHIEPSYKFSSLEREEFLHAAQVLATNHKQYNLDSMQGKVKRAYKRWNTHEKYNLLLCLNVYGFQNIAAIMKILEKRTDNQVITITITIKYNKLSL